MKPLRLQPIPDRTIWESHHISDLRKADQSYGTWWEVSAHPYCTNMVINLDKSLTLQELIEQDPEGLLGPGYTLHELLRLAFLDSKDDLSIQVHPHDAYALKHSNDYGKYESWYIVDAKPNATLVAGTKTADPEVIKQALKEGTLDQYLCVWPVQKGDYITIPAGMLHALGKDIVALEVGTNSNTTYRFYDYGRKDERGNLRSLHLKESFDVADFTLKPRFEPTQKESRRIGDTPCFTVDELYIQKDRKFILEKSYAIVSNLGEDTAILWEQEEIPIGHLESIFVPYSAQAFTLKKGTHVLLSQPGRKD